MGPSVVSGLTREVVSRTLGRQETSRSRAVQGSEAELRCPFQHSSGCKLTQIGLGELGVLP